MAEMATSTFDRAPSWSPITDIGSASTAVSSVDLGPTTPDSLHEATVSSPLPKDLDPHSPWHQDETRCFLRNISNFLALGCITSACTLADQHGYDSPYWSEVFQLPSLPDVCEAVETGIRKLCAAGWIRVFARPRNCGFIDRQSKRLTACLESLLRSIDVSPHTWKGSYTQHSRIRFDLWATPEQGSLFYLFNKIPSPAPKADHVKTHHNRQALEALLDNQIPLLGLQTPLYPYQRRSAGLMLQRESETRLHLDPRIERRTAPDESTFYYGAKDMIFFRNARQYETGKGGILAETMGLGKTLMCLALVLSTKGHLPEIPAAYNHVEKRTTVASLTEMAVYSAARHSVPWRKILDAREARTGETLTRCVQLLENCPPSYEIPQLPQRWNRTTTELPPKRLTLAPTTIIVVPRNLCSQWQSEIQKHVEKDFLSVLVMDDTKKDLPSATELRRFDVVLFSRSRFEQEIRDGSDSQGRRLSRQQQLSCHCPYIGATRVRDCTCLRSDAIYESPLKHLHFLRIVIDEGHFFSNSSSTAAQVATKLVVADHRWVVSGTPAKDLLGVEMDLYSSEAVPMALNDNAQRTNILDQRKQFNAKDDTIGAVKSIGTLASSFLKVRPWSAGEGERAAYWDDYVYRHEDGRKRTYSGFTTSLRSTLEALVVKTQPEDVERDIELPPLTHNIVRLEPSFYDKVTANLFTFVLTANAVTSERTDADYLFHKNSQKARYQLIHNLRQSAFFWTGFSEADVVAAIDHGQGYLKRTDTKCNDEDRRLLEDCIDHGQLILKTNGWKMLSKTHEIGLFLTKWPNSNNNGVYWTFDRVVPLLTGASQLSAAQAHVNSQCLIQDPTDGLAGLGISSVIAATSEHVDDKGKATKVDGDNPVLVKLGIPSSSVNGEPNKKRSSLAGKSKPKKQSVLPAFQIRKVKNTDSKVRATEEQAFAEPLSHRANSIGDRQTAHKDTAPELPLDSKLRKTKIIGTASAKLSYLVSQVYKHYQEEKILIFYEGDNIAYYIAQVLELLHIPHLIYAKSLNPAQKSNYIVRFDNDPHFRILLMDVQQAAFGLNLTSASRVFFVNPVCRPHIEAQAIKRAHRIGQTRPVVVETLILSGTIEEKMFERAKRMSRAEHKEAKVLEDDGGIKEIIQAARPLPISKEERHDYGQIAYLQEPQQLWSRPGWTNWNPGKHSKLATTSPASDKKRRRSATSSEQPGDITADVEQRQAKKVKNTLSNATNENDPPQVVDAVMEDHAVEQTVQPVRSARVAFAENTQTVFHPQTIHEEMPEAMTAGSGYVSIFGGASN